MKPEYKEVACVLFLYEFCFWL